MQTNARCHMSHAESRRARSHRAVVVTDTCPSMRVVRYRAQGTRVETLHAASLHVCVVGSRCASFGLL